MNFSLYEEDGFYKFQIESLLYEYRIENKKTYKNEEFLTFLKNSAPNRGYYEEPSTPFNDPDSLLITSPRNKREDEKFLMSVITILKNTKSEDKKNLINSILNNCLIIDKEPPTFVYIVNPRGMRYIDLKNRGLYHIDNQALSDYYRDTINFASHKYLKKQSNRSKKEQENINLLLR